MILAMAGLKGGQGKTTIGVRLGAWLAVAGHRTVVVDLAPARSASVLMGFGALAGPGSGEVLAGSALADASVREGGPPNLFCVPADATLADAAAVASQRMQQRLRALGASYDFAVLDLPPSDGPVAAAAAAAADWVLVPVVPDELGASGLHVTMDWLAGVRRTGGRSRIAGIVVSQSEPRIAGSRLAEERLRQVHARQVFRASIRRDQAVRAASLARLLANVREPRGADADVLALRRELLRLLVKRG